MMVFQSYCKSYRYTAQFVAVILKHDETACFGDNLHVQHCHCTWLCNCSLL